MATPEQTAPSRIEFYGGYEVYDENGIDLTLIKANLERTTEQRLEHNRGGASFIRACEEARVRDGDVSSPRGRSPVIDAEPILRPLIARGVEFVVIGGMAMRLQGSAHITEDLDLCYRRTPGNILALAEALAPLHPYLRGAPRGLPFRLDAPTIQAGLNFTLDTDHGALDLLGEMSGVGGYELVLAASNEKAVYGLNLRVLTVDGLLAAKRAANRLKDQNHILELEAMKKIRDAGPQGAQP